MRDIRRIDEEVIHPAVHGLGALIALTPDGIAVALVAYGRTNGSLGGIVQTYSRTIDPAGSFDPSDLQSVLNRVDWVLAHGARKTKPILAAILPEIERKPWVCSSGILERHLPPPHMETLALPLNELLARHGLGAQSMGVGLVADGIDVPVALGQVLGLASLLAKGAPSHLGEALRRAGILREIPSGHM